MTIRQTKRCVCCLKKRAVTWNGHVRKGKETVLAGYCKRCDSAVAYGFSGHWRREMGVETGSD